MPIKNSTVEFTWCPDAPLSDRELIHPPGRKSVFDALKTGLMVLFDKVFYFVGQLANLKEFFQIFA